ncbi:MAG: homocysteine S-methyltransferase family protein [Oscillospiraceae bacterium]|jgi:5-methyltetrahydrofolate--homocysteine methyltransferase|nr:homocysteine S-methyltransferase family protein [Oscillospiraceae bacterium]
MNIKDYTQNKILVFDGAMGTMLQKNGLSLGETPELFNLTHPDVVTAIHTAYVKAGANVVSTNTFGANEFKLNNVEEVIAAGVACAKASGAEYVALDVGPLGQMLEPLGTLSFEAAYNAFARQIKAAQKAKADMVILETFSDLYELKAALLAVKENSNLPVICSMTYQEDGRSFIGCDPATMVIAMQALGADAVGVNCSLGPDKLFDVVDKILEYAKVPVIVQANAGLPQIKDGQTVYDITAQEYADTVAKMVQRGVEIVGGCCGTTPEFIKELCNRTDGFAPVKTSPKTVTACTSGIKTVVFDNAVTEIGERINPTGKKLLQQALRTQNYDFIISEAAAQVAAGANVLDINAGLPELDETAVLCEIVRRVQSVTTAPLQLDSSDLAAIEAAARIYNGRPIINSVNGKEESLAKILPIAKKYGALLVALTLDDDGIPKTARKRVGIAKKIVERAQTYGIGREDIIVDCLVLTASAQQTQVMETLRAVTLVKKELGVKTVLGVSNVSFGLPVRELINATFLTAALGAGLDAAIVNPSEPRYREALDAFRVLSAEDANALCYSQKYKDYKIAAAAKPLPGENTAEKSDGTAGQADEKQSLISIITGGRKELAKPTVEQMLTHCTPAQIIDECFIPALNAVGEDFEAGRLFLPQLMLAAQTVGEGFEAVEKFAAENNTSSQSKGKIILATVKGDIHDIGKNIVKMLLQNYGFNVIDLGRDVPPEKVIEAIAREDAVLVGLSALMTTTVKSMKETIAAVKNAGFASCKFMVGGAVLNEEYKDFVGADFYAKDALESVRIAEKVFGLNNKQ